MTQNQNTNNHPISSIKQSILELLDETNDQPTLTRCLDLLQASQKRREEGDEIVKDMAIASQLRNTGSDKQQLLNYTLSAQQQIVGEKEDKTETINISSKSGYAIPYRRLTIGVLTLIGIFVIILLGSKFLHWENRNDEFKYVTVASKYETIEVNGYHFNMVAIEGGTFTMGATTSDGDEDSDERPTQKVTLSNYTIGETEVTQGLWKAVMGYIPASFDGDNHPMKEISWDDCQQFIIKLNQLTKRHFHLPSEAQWEFAARGGNLSKNYKYAGSNHIEEVAWYSANAWDKGKESPDFGNHAVGTRKPNELGLYDMSGNVWEWCQDSYAHYDGTPQKDPVGPMNSKNSFRVNRGGSWDYIAESARCCNRRNRTPDFRNFNLGMRLAE